MNSINSMSVIIYDGCFRQRHHLVECLTHQQELPRDFEILWVDYYDGDYELPNSPYLKRINLCNDKDTSIFVSKCHNAGIRASSGELLMHVDGDVWIQDDFIRQVISEHEKRDDLALYLHRLDQTEEHPMDILDPGVLVGTVKVTNPTNHGGCLSVRRKNMLAANGWEMHPVFEGRHFWGSLELYTRFKNLGLSVKWHPSLRCYHAWHPWPASPRENLDAQKEIMRRRLFDLDPVAYRGLDSAMDHDPPWLEEWKEKYFSATPGDAVVEGPARSYEQAEAIREGVRKGWLRSFAHGKTESATKLALFGAGRHTRKLIDSIRCEGNGARVVAILDDDAASLEELQGIPVYHPDEFDSASADMLVLSSDTFVDEMQRRCECMPLNGLPVVSLYSREELNPA